MVRLGRARMLGGSGGKGDIGGTQSALSMSSHVKSEDGEVGSGQVIPLKVLLDLSDESLELNIAPPLIIKVNEVHLKGGVRRGGGGEGERRPTSVPDSAEMGREGRLGGAIPSI